MAVPPRALPFPAAAAAGVAANVLLGLSSLFWKLLAAIPPVALLCIRIVASLVTLTLVMAMLGRFRALATQLTARNLAIHAVAAVLVAINWVTFIWASIHGHVIESGLGYLLAPFVAIGAGSLVYRERLGRGRTAALLLIALCVLVLSQRSQELAHWVYLAIGSTWGAYACMKKATSLDGFGGLFCETVVLALALTGVLMAGSPSLPMLIPMPLPLPGQTLALLAASGMVSVLPLWLFSRAAASLPMSVMGFFQFVLPLTQLVVALVFYRQPLSLNSLLCFGVICAALLSILCGPALARRRHPGPGAANEIG